MSQATVDVRKLPSANGSRPSTAPMQENLRKRWLRIPKFLTRALPSSWERVIVNNSVDSITMPKWIASAILISVLGFGVQSWWARTTDHDTMIEIRTELRLAKESEKTDKDEIKARAADLAAWQGIMNGNYREIIGMLKQSQVDALDKSGKKTNQ